MWGHIVLKPIKFGGTNGNIKYNDLFFFIVFVRQIISVSR